MKQVQPKFVILIPLIILALILAGCAREREQPSEVVPSEPLEEAVAQPISPITGPGGEAVQTTPPLPPSTPGLETRPTTISIQPTATSTPLSAQEADTEIPATATATPITSLPGAPTTQERIHIVQAGQNLFRIALQYGVDLDTLAEYNGITNPALIYVGQKIRIPGQGYGPDGSGNVYIVQAGDTLLSIARMFNTSVEALMSANDLANPDVIKIGQALNVP